MRFRVPHLNDLDFGNHQFGFWGTGTAGCEEDETPDTENQTPKAESRKVFLANLDFLIEIPHENQNRW